MSPFSQFLVELRSRRNVNQAELARRLGYAKSYISALEQGQKGPPNQVFLQCLVDYFALNEREVAAMYAAAKASKRSFVLQPNASVDLYRFVSRLREALPDLNGPQIRFMNEVMDLFESASPSPLACDRKATARRREEAQM